MTYHARLEELLQPVFGQHIYPDAMPSGFRPLAPALVYQQVGGVDAWYVDHTLPEYQNARLQFFVWGEYRYEVALKMEELRATMANAVNLNIGFITEPFGAPVDDYNEVLKLRGARQDFGLWYKSPDP